MMSVSNVASDVVSNTAKTSGRKTRGDKREMILRAALKVFSSGGVNGVPMPKLAEEAGISTGLIYRYFESKEALVNELYQEQKQKLATILYVKQAPDTPPYDAYWAVWTRMVVYATEYRDAFRFLELQDHRPYLNKSSMEVESDVLTPFMKYYRLMQKRKVFRTDMRAEVMMTMHWGSFVKLFKSKYEGIIELSQQDIDVAGEAGWQFLTGK